MGWFFSGMCKPPVFAGACNIQNKPFPGVPSYWSQNPRLAVGGSNFNCTVHIHHGMKVHTIPNMSPNSRPRRSHPQAAAFVISGFLLVQNLRLGTLVFLLGCWLQARTSGVWRLVGLSIVFNYHFINKNRVIWPWNRFLWSFHNHFLPFYYSQRNMTSCRVVDHKDPLHPAPGDGQNWYPGC